MTSRPPGLPIVGPSEQSKRDLFLDIMLRRLDAQYGRINSLATERTTWLTVPSLILTFLATILVVERESFAWHSYALIVLGFVLFLAGLIVLYTQNPWGKNWLDGPGWEELAVAAEDPGLSTDALAYSVAYALGQHTINRNYEQIQSAERKLGVGIGLSISSITLLLLVVAINLPAANPQASPATTPPTAGAPPGTPPGGTPTANLSTSSPTLAPWVTARPA